MLISLHEYAEKYKKDPRAMRKKAQTGGFATAVKIGRDWLIDEAEPLTDRRVRSGKYVGARKRDC